ncbi:TolC family outer membrane protein [Vibrio sp. Of7-15]|uniref:TolC family outer membrane protein n=1 Tax=Vibrio sp. Of7-15 TaxID=2724879 RepID=UPI001EF2530B|nr:TolC family outer membrane protein [Vibrio sp. Of7-15]MCG7497919.1 TolC family outer membrane protein [Vibrio sp. Of7-15]
MNWKKLTLAASISTLSLATQAQSLEQAVAITLATNPEIRSAFHDFKSRQQDINGAIGAYRPSLDLDAGIGYENVDTVRGTETDLTRKEATLTLTQLIWDGSSTYNDINRTEAETESLRYQLLSDAQDKALNVVEIYINAIKAEEVLKLSENNLFIHKKIYKDIKKRTNSGIGSTADLVQVEARLSRAHSNLLAAQNNLFDAHTQFRRAVGQEPQDLIKPEVDELALPLSLQDAIKTATSEHPVLKVSAEDIEAAQFQYKQSQGVNYPTISFEASQSWQEDAGGLEGQTDEFTAMIRMRYNLYNGGADRAASVKAAYQVDKSKDLRDNALRMLEEGTHLSWNALNYTQQQKEFLAEHVDAAAKTVIAYEKQFRIGKRTLLDLLNTENELFEARKSYLDANYSEDLAKYRVLNATGSLLNALRVDIPDEWSKSVKNSAEDK